MASSRYEEQLIEQFKRAVSNQNTMAMVVVLEQVKRLLAAESTEKEKQLGLAVVDGIAPSGITKLTGVIAHVQGGELADVAGKIVEDQKGALERLVDDIGTSVTRIEKELFENKNSGTLQGPIDTEEEAQEFNPKPKGGPGSIPGR